MRSGAETLSERADEELQRSSSGWQRALCSAAECKEKHRGMATRLARSASTVQLWIQKGNDHQ